MPDTTKLQAYYAAASDAELQQALRAGPTEYNPDAWIAIAQEGWSRGIFHGPIPEAVPVGAVEAVQRTLDECAGLLARGADFDSVVLNLRERGATRDDASKCVRAAQTIVYARRQAAEAQIKRGGVYLGAGVLVTVASFIAAPNGGGFVLATGAIAAGLYNLITGNLRLQRAGGGEA